MWISKKKLEAKIREAKSDELIRQLENNADAKMWDDIEKLKKDVKKLKKWVKNGY